MAAFATAVVQRGTKRLSSDIWLSTVLRYPLRKLANFALDRVPCLCLPGHAKNFLLSSLKVNVSMNVD